MNQRLKKLLGTVAFAAGTSIYFLFAISIAIARLPDTPLGTHLLFYAIATMVWLVWAGLLIRWMQKPTPPKTPK
jgi:hypothetical protein